jgi:hypothetical protein
MFGITFPLITAFIVILIVIFLIALFVWGLKYAILFAINSVIGFFALYAVQAFVWSDLIINIWSVALVAIGGIFGFALVLLFHLLGIFF